MRAICLVLDGFGLGETHDAEKYGDCGANTLGNICKSLGGLKLPNLEKLGLGNTGSFLGINGVKNPLATVSRLSEKSEGKDTTTGHWEIAGLVTQKAFPLFPQGFSQALLDDFVREAGLPGVLGNRPASGTVIIEELGIEHIKTGKPIVYTSGDSVFQIAAHEKYFGLEKLYQVCEIARRLTFPLQIGRVIARPFVGEEKKQFIRTEHRRDYSIAPSKNLLDFLHEEGVRTCSIGKIDDIFNHRSLTCGNHTGNNRDGMKATNSFLNKFQNEKTFIFANLVDFDQLYGHRRDVKGYANCLVEFDGYLSELLKTLKEDDLLILTGDHGCDPTFKGSDHTRELVPYVGYSPRKKGKWVPDRDSFADIAATVFDFFEIDQKNKLEVGNSLW